MLSIRNGSQTDEEHVFAFIQKTITSQSKKSQKNELPFVVKSKIFPFKANLLNNRGDDRATAFLQQ